MAVQVTDPQKLKADLITVLDEHGLEFLSFTLTDTRKRRHGQLQFEINLEAQQGRLDLNGTKAAQEDLDREPSRR